MALDMDQLMTELSKKREIFVSEADFQLELAWLIKEQYPDAKVRLEYCPALQKNMRLDILVTIDGKWIPIELKYKKKGFKAQIEDEYYDLRDHGAKDHGCYDYLKDIQRIETLKKKAPPFQEGYAILLTNDPAFRVKPKSKDAHYSAFSIHEGAVKHGTMDWGPGTGDGTKGRDRAASITLAGSYKMHWKPYSEMEGATFQVLISKIS